MALQEWVLEPSIPISTAHRAADRVIVLRDGENLPGRIAARGRVEAQGTFHDMPAIVLSTRAGRRLEVNLFAGRLPNIANEKITRLSVEGNFPRISQTIGPYLFSDPGGWVVKERVARRDAI